MLRDFNAKIERKAIFRPTLRKVGLHKIAIDKTIKLINLQHQKFNCESTTFLHNNIPNGSPDQVDNRRLNNIIDVGVILWR